jgi:dTDP-4-amino-4,6-dideoxygalactose transaminase
LIPFWIWRLSIARLRRVDAAIARAVESAQFVLGPEVAAFETRFAAYCNVNHCLAVNSGTSALHLALLAAGIGPGVKAARPVFVDVDPVTWTMDPALIEAAITSRTKAVLPVHLRGLTADMDPIMAIARQHGLVVIEDAAQAHGAEYKGAARRRYWRSRLLQLLSRQNLGTFGEGGAVVNNQPDLARKISLLRLGTGSAPFVIPTAIPFLEKEEADAAREAVLSGWVSLQAGDPQPWRTIRASASFPPYSN